MRLPKTVKIGPFKYTIAKSSKDLDGDSLKHLEDVNAIGMTDTKQLRIYVDPELAPGAEREVAMHEILHSIFYTMSLNTRFNYKEEEYIVGALGVGLLQFIRDNPSFITYLQQKD